MFLLRLVFFTKLFYPSGCVFNLLIFLLPPLIVLIYNQFTLFTNHFTMFYAQLVYTVFMFVETFI